MAIAEPDAQPTAAPSRAAPLRLGLLVDSLTQPAWVERALRRIIESGDGEFVVIIRNDATEPAGSRRASRLSSWWRNRHHLLYAAYQRLDRRRLRGTNDPFAPVDVAPLLKGVPVLGVTPVRGKATDTIEAPDLERHVGAGEPGEAESARGVRGRAGRRIRDAHLCLGNRRQRALGNDDTGDRPGLRGKCRRGGREQQRSTRHCSS